MTIFISGGCKNGKSTLAEDCCIKLAEGGPLYYVATMVAYDDEDRERIKRHRKNRRGKGFRTLEQPRNIISCLKKSDSENSTYLIDSVTALLINEMYDPERSEADPNAAERTARELTEFAAKVKNAVFVSDYIYSEGADYSQYTEEYMKALAVCDKALAQACDCVAEITAAIPNVYKGELPL